MTTLQIVMVSAAALAGLLALRRGLAAAGAFVLIRALCDLLRAGTGYLRSGAPPPYVGADQALWVLGDVAPTVAIPALLVGLAGAPGAGMVLGAGAFAIIVGRYPIMRGDSLLHAYALMYGAAYFYAYTIGLVGATQSPRWSRRWYAPAALAWVGALGCASVALVMLYGRSSWWTLAAPNGAMYAGLATAALLSARTGRPRPAIA